MDDDLTLLREYARNNSESAFATLVSRHVNLVYSVALRSVHDAHLAEEITQAAFIILARKAHSLDDKTILSGWLCRTARYASANALTIQSRRQYREQEAYMQSHVNEAAPDKTWNQIAPVLDAAMGKLRKKDHDALVLRFFEGRNFKEVGDAMGTSEDAAKMRVGRALDKLRKNFTKRGITSTTAIIAGTLSINSIQAAPVTLAQSVTAGAVIKGAAASATTLTLIKGALKVMAWTKIKTAALVGTGILLLAGTTAVAYKGIEDLTVVDSWRVQPNFDSRVLDQAAPQVAILPTIFKQFGGFGSSGNKIMGLGAPVNYMIQDAWDYGSYRTVFATPIPQGRYDYIASLPSGNDEALQDAIKKKFGLVVHTATVETNVLLLQVVSPNAPGLISSDNNGGWGGGGGGMSTGNRTFQSQGEPISILAGFLESHYGIPVIDQTGLKGDYDINLKWRNQDDLKKILSSQLGLELVPGQAPVEMLIVDKAQ
jgi:uncharacterized protein (TIGR03435 family)